MSKPSKTDLWYPFFIGDYRRDTARLSCEQHGAYRLLIDEYWITGPLPDDDVILARLVGLELRTWRKHRPVIARFFEVASDEWRHGRIDRELIAAGERKAKAEGRAKAAAEARWSKPRKDAPGDATSMLQALRQDVLEECPPPSPRESEDASASSVGSAEPMPTGPWSKDADFVAAWNACTTEGRARSSRKASWPIWRKHPAAGPAKLAALKAYLASDPDVKRTGGPGFHLWLRDKLDEWLDRETAPTHSAAAPWNGPPAIVAIMEGRLGKAKGAAYLAQYCTWQEVPCETLIVSHRTIAEAIRREAGSALEAHGVAIDVKGRAA